MHGQMGWSSHPMNYGGGEHQMNVPLIPAPVAFFAMIFGVMIGIMIGRKRSMMHGMGHDMSWGGSDRPDWAMRKKMMGDMAAHHHHGDGEPACGCGCGEHSSTAEQKTGD